MYCFIFYLQLNAAGQRYFQLLDKWTTRGTMNPTKTDLNGAEVEFHGFHGEYIATVTLPNGNFVGQKFKLEPGKDEFKVVFDIGKFAKPHILVSLK